MLLLGTTAMQRAQTCQWLRRCELNITENIHNAYHHAEGLARFRDRIPVAPEAATGLKRVAQDRVGWLDGMLDGHAYITGDSFTTVDIWLYVWLDFADSVGQPFDRHLRNTAPWFARIAARPSAAASLHAVGSRAAYVVTSANRRPGWSRHPCKRDMRPHLVCRPERIFTSSFRGIASFIGDEPECTGRMPKPTSAKPMAQRASRGRSESIR